ncbi:natterin-4 isoform X2 [Anabrus simplex]
MIASEIAWSSQAPSQPYPPPPSGVYAPPATEYPPPSGSYPPPYGSAYVPPPPSAPMYGAPGTGSPTWVDTYAGQIPPTAVVGGYDNEQLYVGRANHGGALLPGKVVPSHGACYVAWGGYEHRKENYQVLCGCQAMWVPCAGGEVPSDALPSGETEDGEPLFVGRVQHNGTMTLGKVQESHRVCYIPYGGQEIAYSQYEVLVAK